MGEDEMPKEEIIFPPRQRRINQDELYKFIRERIMELSTGQLLDIIDIIISFGSVPLKAAISKIIEEKEMGPDVDGDPLEFKLNFNDR